MAGQTATTSVFTSFLQPDLPEPYRLPAFIVLQLDRYYPEPSSRRRYGLDGCRFWDVFDVTLCDRTARAKLVLTAAAGLRHKANIRAGTFVRLLNFSRFWDEASVRGNVLVVIHQLDVVSETPPVEDTTDLARLPWCEGFSCKQMDNLPLISRRRYYMDTWSFSVDTPNLNCEVQTCDLSSIDLRDVVCIGDVTSKKVSLYSRPAVLVKVMRKCRLVHYISSSREDPWPFQLPLTVADRSGWCSVVLWNQLALQMEHHISEGSILYLKNFRVKPSIQQQTKSFFSPPHGTNLFQCEFSMDSPPPTQVKLVTYPADSVSNNLDFPPLESCLMTRRNLISVQDLSTVDVAGLITFVGRVEREARKDVGDRLEDSGAFFYRRWVLLRDSSLSEPIVALIYSGEQEDMFFSLRPGQCLLCRHMLTNQGLDSLTSSRQQRHGWLTTTAYSWLYMFTPSDTASLPPGVLPDFARTSLPGHPSDYSDLFLEGGMFRYPPFACSIESLEKSKSDALEAIIPSSQWREICDKMTWRECHQLTVHAFLVSAIFTRVSRENTSAVRSPPRKRRSVTENIPDNTSDDTVNTSDLGATLSEDISELWPSALSGSHSNCYSAFLIKWRGLNDPVVINSIKPCAFSSRSEINNFVDLVAGVYDADLGLVDCVRSTLVNQEIKMVEDSVQSLVNSRFLLVLDVYTNRDNRQLIVLNRAFKI
ncbi:hypothetical protein BsWGS_26382 [Bradybaena similaris]